MTQVTALKRANFARARASADKAKNDLDIEVDSTATHKDRAALERVAKGASVRIEVRDSEELKRTIARLRVTKKPDHPLGRLG
ncbi:MAG TPA: hypothetical protein VG898_02260 [Solirubrobacterales bacterium]|nr:hypothetical protein [Solirubrobacterales bacterium]